MLSVGKPGGWSGNELLTSAQLNAIKVALEKGLDGVDGGTYTLLSPLRFEGADVQIRNRFRAVVGGFITVDVGAFLTVAGTATVSGTLDVTGTANVKNGGSLRIRGTSPGPLAGSLWVEGGAEVRHIAGSEVFYDTGSSIGLGGVMTVTNRIDIASTGRVDVEAGGDVNLLAQSGATPGGKLTASQGASIQVYDSGDLKINSSSTAFRLTLNPLIISRDSSQVPDWVPFAGTIPVWVQEYVGSGAGRRFIGFALPLKVGDVISTLTATVRGGMAAGTRATVPTTRPSFSLNSLDMAGNVTQHASFTDDHNTAPSYRVDHTIVLSSASVGGGVFPFTILAGKLYYVSLLGESDGGSEVDQLGLLAIDGTLTAKSFRQSSEIYGG